MMNSAALEALKEGLYRILQSRYGFRFSEQVRTPGYEDGMVRGSVEVFGVPTERGLRIDVSVFGPRPGGFYRTVCGDVEFYSPSEEFYADEAGLQQCASRIVGLLQNRKTRKKRRRS